MAYAVDFAHIECFPDLMPEEFHTPNVKTIAEVAQFTGLPETSQMKSLVMVGDGRPVLALLRGDHQLSEAKLASALDAADVRAAHPEEKPFAKRRFTLT